MPIENELIRNSINKRLNALQKAPETIASPEVASSGKQNKPQNNAPEVKQKIKLKESLKRVHDKLEINRHKQIELKNQIKNKTAFATLKDLGTELLENLFFLVGFNAAINWAHNRVAEKFIIPILHKKHSFDENKLVYLATDILKDTGLCKNPIINTHPAIHEDHVLVSIQQNKNILNEAKQGINKSVKLFIKNNEKFEAYYTEDGNKIVVSKNSLTSMFHEIGHAFQENKTTILKYLQRFRGHYTVIATLLFFIGRNSKKKQNDNDNNKNHNSVNIITNVREFLGKHRNIVPFIAFAPELITEIAASRYGIKFLKAQKADKALIKEVGKHYIAAFTTYLLFPLSIVTAYFIDNAIDKNKKNKMNYNEENLKLYEEKEKILNEMVRLEKSVINSQKKTLKTLVNDNKMLKIENENLKQ